MAGNPAFESLVRSLKDADSAFERMHALGLAWRSIRGLSPDERKALARYAGFEGAEELVEKLALHDGGIAPAILLQAIQEARQSKPQRLKSIFASLRDPETRGRTILRAVDAVASRISGVEEEPPPEVAASPETQQPSTKEPAPEIEKRTAETQEERMVDSPVQPVPGREESSGIQPNEEDSGRTKTTPETPEAEEATPPPPGSADTRSEISTPVETLPVSEESQRNIDRDENLRHEVEDEISASAQAQAPENTTLIDRLEEASTLFEKFRILGDPELEIVNRASLNRMIKDFPAGWAQRRAIQLLMDNDRIADPDDALDICKEIRGKHNQRWVLHEIQRKWELEEQENGDSIRSS